MKSIALKLWLGMMALVLVVLVLLIFFQIVFLDKFYTEMRVSDIKSESHEIAKGLEKGDQSGFENSLEEFAYNNNLTAELLDMNYNTIYITQTTGGSGQMPMGRSSLVMDACSKVLSGQEVSLSMTHPRFGSKFMLIGLPVKVSGNKAEALLISLPMASVSETVNILKVQLIYIAVILLVSSLILSFLLSRTFTKPILDITKVSQDMASGNLSARIKLKRKDEIGRLGETINSMGEGLSKIDQLRKDLIANISHELRTPLSLIKGYAETIRDISGDNKEKRDRQINIIIEESDRLSKIVDDVLNLSQLQSGYIDLSINKFPVDEMLERVVKRYEILSSRTGVNIFLENLDKTVVQADEKRIEQVMYNLVNNAFNHTKIGDTITVKAASIDDKVMIEVSDTGEGIPEDELGQIWERFYKIDKSGRRSESGSGLGLAIVKSILSAHNFDYGVRSQVGIGTTFWLQLKK